MSTLMRQEEVVWLSLACGRVNEGEGETGKMESRVSVIEDAMPVR